MVVVVGAAEGTSLVGVTEGSELTGALEGTALVGGNVVVVLNTKLLHQHEVINFQGIDYVFPAKPANASRP